MGGYDATMALRCIVTAMPLLSSYLSETSLIMGFRATHVSLGTCVVTGIVRYHDNDYVCVKFDHDGCTLEFPADIFLGQWEWGAYFTHSLDDFSLLSNLCKSSINPNRTSLPTLGMNDYRLCLAWAGHPPNKIPEPDEKKLEKLLGTLEAGRLMSARVAELVAINYFGALGHQVQDVSITQIYADRNSQWKDFDLLVDGHPVDVKNARKSFNSREMYVEHCVPRFKQDRETSIDVSILGVLSEFQQPSKIAEGKGVCVILGEVKISEIRRLYVWMRNRFGDLIDFKGLWAPDYQPGWVFEYSPEFYRERIAAINQVENAIQHFKSSDIGTEYIHGWLLALCRDKRVIDRLSLSPAKQLILDDLHDLNEKIGLTRPVLFIYVMAHFLEAINQEKDRDQVIPPLRSIILASDAEQDILSSPLGLKDPQRYISSLINVFEQVFDKIRKQGIKFTRFKLQHPSILKGMTTTGSWVTLFAYCGGWLTFPFEVKCGATPLYLGRHDTCQTCCRLICDKCGFCSNGCNLVAERQEKFAREASASKKLF